MARRDRDWLPFSSTVHPLSFTSQPTKAPTDPAATRQSASSRHVHGRYKAEAPAKRRLLAVRDVGPPGLERNVVGLGSIWAGAHDGANAVLTKDCSDGSPRKLVLR